MHTLPNIFHKLKRLRAGAGHWWRQLRQMLRTVRGRLPQPVKLAIRRLGRVTARGLVTASVILTGLFVAAHYWLPTVVEKKSEIERYLTETIGNPVQLGGLATFWDGLNPGLRVQDLRITAANGESALRLREAQLSLSWRALLLGNIEIKSLTLVGPQLTVERSAEGRLRVTGLVVKTTTTTQGPDFSDWLLRQREIVIVDGELEWIDQTVASGQPSPEYMTVRAVQATIRNDGAQHTFDLLAAFPENVCKACRVYGTIHGDPLQDDDWEGAISVQGRGLSLQHLPGAVRRQLPHGLAGELEVTLTARWREAQLEGIHGQVLLNAFSMPVKDAETTLQVRQIDTDLDWQLETDGWQLRLNRLRVALAGRPWIAGALDIKKHAEDWKVSVENVDVTDVVSFLAHWPRRDVLHQWLGKAQPGGALSRVRLAWRGQPSSPEEVRVEARAEGLHFLPVGEVPGVRGLSGWLTATQAEGELQIDSTSGRLELPRVMREPIAFDQWSSRVRWNRSAEDWWVQVSDVMMRNADARLDGRMELRIPLDTRQSPVMKLKMDLRDGRGDSIHRYFPRITPERLRGYLIEAVRDGRLTRATAVVEGALNNFPFLDGQGKFEIRAHVKNGVLEYLPGWPRLHSLDVDMLFNGTGMLLTSDKGVLRNLQVGRVTVAIEDFRAPGGAVLTVHGRAAGTAADALAVLEESKSPQFTPWLVPGLRAQGQGVLDLNLRVPLASASPITLNGEYRPTGVTLSVPGSKYSIEALRGLIGFNENGPSNGQLDARWLGSALQLKAEPNASGGALVKLDSKLSAKVTRELLGPTLGAQVNGVVPWALRWRTGLDRHQLDLEADLREVEIKLPAPLEKARGEPLLLQVRYAGREGAATLIDLNAGNRLAGKLSVQNTNDHWTVTRGRIAIGERAPALPFQDGLHISARLPVLNIDHWWPILQPAWEQSGAEAGLGLITRLSAEVSTLYFMDRPFGRLNLEATRGSGYWSGRLDGESVAGQALFTTGCAPGTCPPTPPGGVPATERPGLQLSLERLAVPLASPGARSGKVDPRGLPFLQLRSKSFRYAQHDLGTLDFSAEPSFAGWRINSVKLYRPQFKLQAKGLWATNRQGVQNSRFELQLNSGNLGEALRLFEFGGELVGGKLNMQSNWNWDGAPGDFSLAGLNGDAVVELKDGRLPNVSPGAGRLFGAFDLRSVTRILTLNFSSLFAKGLSFDRIHGKLEVREGNAYTRNFTLLVPGADIELRGRIGLHARDMDLDMDVTPRVSSNLAPVIGGTLLGGPIVGGAIAVLGGVTRKPFEKSTRAEYTVKGPWSEPVVDSVRGAVRSDESPP